MSAPTLDAKTPAKLRLHQSNGEDGRYSKLVMSALGGSLRMRVELTHEQLGQLISGVTIHAVIESWQVKP